MIAKGNLHGSGGALARYLMTGNEEEIAQLVETRGLDYFGKDPVRAFEMLQKVAEANTRSTRPFFHVQTRNPDGDKPLTVEQWLEIADREEKRLGLTGQPRIVSFHIDRESGEKHLHVGWFRVDLETMRAIDPGMYKNHLKQLCRSLEKEFGLQEVSSVRKPDDKARIADRKEVEESRRLGTDVRDIRAGILDCLERTDGGKAFRAALEERGLTLANGDRRDCFVVIDQAGGQHALNKKLTGLTLAVMRDRLGDLDRAELPSLDQAKAQQQELNSKGRETAQPEPAKQHEPDQPTEERAAEPAAQHGEKWHQRDATKMEERIFRVLEAAERGDAPVAAGLQAEGITLARVDATGKADMDAEYRRQFENAKLEDIRQGTDEARLRRSSFKEGELVAVTKSGNVYRLNPRFIDAEKLERAATGGSEQTPTLSAAREHYATARQQQKDDRAGAWDAKKEFRAEERACDRTANAFSRAPGQAADKFTDAGLKGLDGAGKIASLGSFVESLLGMKAQPEPMTAEQRQLRATEALERIEDSIQRGDRLSPSDVANLLPTQLDNLKLHGDAYMLEMISDLERQRERDAGGYDGGRERER